MTSKIPVLELILLGEMNILLSLTFSIPAVFTELCVRQTFGAILFYLAYISAHIMYSLNVMT